MTDASRTAPDQTPWLNPVGGLGDMLMVSGVLKLVSDQDPKTRFNLTRRTNYLPMFEGHPAIQRVGYPPKGARIIPTAYWSIEDVGPGERRPFQILARHYGLDTPVPEKLFFPGAIPDDGTLHTFIPWRRKNILIAPASDSPRKMMSPRLWSDLVRALMDEGHLVLQAGRSGDRYVRGAYSLLGLTHVGQLLAVLRKCELVVTSDNFVMHAAAMLGVKAVVLWGPTQSKVYGHDGHIHLRAVKTCGLEDHEERLGPQRNQGGKLYGEPCPHGKQHCMDLVAVDEIIQAVKDNV